MRAGNSAGHHNAVACYPLSTAWSNIVLAENGSATVSHQNHSWLAVAIHSKHSYLDCDEQNQTYHAHRGFKPVAILVQETSLWGGLEQQNGNTH